MEPSTTEVYFNSKSKENYLLSNFYGGVEANYMSHRFMNPEIKQLFRDFETCDSKKFFEYLRILQPEKKPTNYWFKNGEPIRGILSKLVGNSVKGGKAYAKRLEIIKELAGIDEVIISPSVSIEERNELMLSCLREKYTRKEYRDLLLATGTSILHEKPLRGFKSEWTYPGDDLLGRLLMQVRDEIRIL